MSDTEDAYREASKERDTARAEAARLREAIGLLATLHPSMPVNTDDPVGMAQKIEAHVRSKVGRLTYDLTIANDARAEVDRLTKALREAREERDVALAGAQPGASEEES